MSLKPNGKKHKRAMNAGILILVIMPKFVIKTARIAMTAMLKSNKGSADLSLFFIDTKIPFIMK